jgi:hypothetical protein
MTLSSISFVCPTVKLCQLISGEDLPHKHGVLGLQAPGVQLEVATQAPLLSYHLYSTTWIGL